MDFLLNGLNTVYCVCDYLECFKNSILVEFKASVFETKYVV